MNAVRKLRPPRRPETLAELVLDFEERSPGEPEADVQFPAQDWAHLVSRAEHEKNAKLAVGEQEESSMVKLQRDALTRVVQLEQEANEFRAEREVIRLELAEALSLGRLNSIDEMFQVVRGLVMAREIERIELAALRTKHNGTTEEAAAYERGYQAGLKDEAAESAELRRRFGAAIGVIHDDATAEHLIERTASIAAEWRTLKAAAEPKRPNITFDCEPPTVDAWKDDKVRLILVSGGGVVLTHAAGRELAHQVLSKIEKVLGDRDKAYLAEAAPAPAAPVPCKHCGDTDHVEAICGLAPSEPIDDEEEGPAIVEPTERQLMDGAGRRLNGAGWKRHAKHARETNSTAACHHCGDETDEHALCVKNSEPRDDGDLPTGTFCPGCVLRLKANPREWDRHTAPPKAKVTQHRGAKLNLSGMDRKTANAARLADSGYQARARKAVKEKSPSTCHHCGAGISEDTGGLGTWRPDEEGGDPDTAPSTACTECMSRMRESLKPAAVETPKRKRRMLITEADPQSGLAIS